MSMNTKQYVVDLKQFDFYTKRFEARSIEEVMGRVRADELGAFEEFVEVEVEDGRWLVYRSAEEAERDEDNSLAVGQVWDVAIFPERHYQIRGE